MKPYRLLIPIVVVCLLLVSARASRSADQEQAPDLTPSRVQAQPNAPLYLFFHPRFYKEYGELSLSSTLYLQNPNETTANLTLDFYDCESGTWVVGPAPFWSIPPKATQVAGAGDFPGLDPGCYGLVIASDSEFELYGIVVEDTWSGGSATDRLAALSGFRDEKPAVSLRFGPFLKGDVNSTVHIWNTSWYGTANVTAIAYPASGPPIGLPPCTAGPYAQCTYDVSALSQLLTPFDGVLAIQSTGGSLVGVMSLVGTSGDVYEYRKPLAVGAAAACLPRVLKHVNEGGVTRSTALFVANASDQAADANLVFYDRDGAPVAAASQGFDLAANGSRYLKLAEMPALPDGIWSVCASGNGPLALEELTRAHIPSTWQATSGTHGVSRLAGNSLAVTHLMRGDAAYTAFSVQNVGPGTADVDLKYYDLAGSLVHTDTVKLPPRGWARFNQSTQSELGSDFVGSPVLSSNQPLVSLVDAYVPPDLSRIYLPAVQR